MYSICTHAHSENKLYISVVPLVLFIIYNEHGCIHNLYDKLTRKSKIKEIVLSLNFNLSYPVFVYNPYRANLPLVWTRLGPHTSRTTN